MVDEALMAAARRLGNDAVTVEVVQALRAHGVRPVLLRGPVLERWLYPGGSDRRYNDIDLLVAPDSFQAAERTLAAMGFQMKLAGGRPVIEIEDDEHEWRRGEYVVDLHRGIWGFEAGWPDVWSAVSERSEQIEIDGARVDAPIAPVLALVVAVHAVRHGSAGKPMEDLRRALMVADDSVWQEAAAVAQLVRASGAFSLGLSLMQPGRQLLRRLDLSSPASVEAHIRAGGTVPTSIGFLRLATAPTMPARVRLVWGVVWPSTALLRHAYPVARHGRLGLVAARVWRPLWLCRRAPAGWRAWRRAEARARADLGI